MSARTSDAGSAPTQSSGDEVTVGQALAIAVERHQQGRITEAQTLYERILAVEPQCAEALHFLGLIRFQTGDHDAALEYLRRAIQVSPDYVAAVNNLGNLLNEQKRFAEAEAQYRKVIALEPRFADAYSNLGMVLKEQKHLVEAETVLRKAVELQPDHLQALNNLGALLKDKGALDEAVEVLRTALSLRPEFPEALHNLGLVYEAKGMYPEAERLLHEAVERGVNASINLGRVLRDQGRVDEAMEIYRKVIDSGERVGEGYYNLGMLLEATGRHAEAVDAFSAWCEREPDDEVARHMLAACTGNAVPERASDDYVQSVFDGFASTFESRLKSLEYRAPELLTEVLGECVAAAGDKSVLDAGCGTGLCGPLLQGFARRLVGVDLSEGMLALARDRGIYDELIAAELTRYLETTEDRFDVVMCADTLVYFGDLHAVIDGFQRVLEADGVLVFSVEQTGPLEQDFRLLPHGRYAHNADYVGKLLGDAGFDPVDMRPGVLRLEVGQPVNGLLVTARKPA